MNPSVIIMLVAFGGAIGSVSRWAMATFVNHHWPSHFPWATFIINVLGSSAFGVVYQWIMTHEQLREPVRWLLLVGFMGAFTTFSTFSFETLRLLENGKILFALANVAGQVCVCLLGTWAGMVLGKMIFH